jgi:fructokinase
MSRRIVCVGEILWDALPAGLFLGGAPFNVASHLHVLGEAVGVGSRVGDDVLGDEALRRLRARGLSDALVQVDDTLPTGLVRVDLTPTDDPDYEIVEPAAWDALARPDALQDHVDRAAALVFGSLAQRSTPARRTIQRLCKTDGLRVFDVNLRPPHVDRTVVEYSLRLADVVKVNEHELTQLCGWFGLATDPEAALADLADTFACSTVCVTLGDQGARLWREGTHWHHPGHPVEVADPVGAGDAFLAAFLSGLLHGRDGEALLNLANGLGAYVAAHPGAFPDYEVSTLDDILRLSPGNQTSAS